MPEIPESLYPKVIHEHTISAPRNALKNPSRAFLWPVVNQNIYNLSQTSKTLYVVLPARPIATTSSIEVLRGEVVDVFCF